MLDSVSFDSGRLWLDIFVSLAFYLFERKIAIWLNQSTTHLPIISRKIYDMFYLFACLLEPFPAPQGQLQVVPHGRNLHRTCQLRVQLMQSLKLIRKYCTNLLHSVKCPVIIDCVFASQIVMFLPVCMSSGAISCSSTRSAAAGASRSQPAPDMSVTGVAAAVSKTNTKILY